MDQNKIIIETIFGMLTGIIIPIAVFVWLYKDAISLIVEMTHAVALGETVFRMISKNCYNMTHKGNIEPSL